MSIHYRTVDVDLGCWMKMSALPRTWMIDVIATCRFVKSADKVPTGVVVVIVVWVLGFTESTTGCRPATSFCYVVYSFLQNKQNSSRLVQAYSK